MLRRGKQDAAYLNKLVRRVFQTKHNLQLEPGVVAFVENIFNDNAEAFQDEGTGQWGETMVLEWLENFVKGCQGTGIDAPKTISMDLIAKVYDDLKDDGDTDGQQDAHDLSSKHFLDIVDAFEMPAWRWQEESNVFERAPKASLAPAPTGKAQYQRDRFNVIKQTILRNEHFSPPTITGHERAEYMKLTSIKNLLGRQGSHFLIFGLLARMEDGAFYLEDLDDKVELDLSEATKESGLFTEGCYVLVDGDYTHDSVFKVNEMGHPPSESRSDALKIFGHHDFLGIGALSIEEHAKRLAAERSKAHETSFLIFSDVHLDNPKTFAALKTVLEGYEGLDPVDQPSLFVFFGNFRSRPFLFDGESSREYEELFTSLGRLLSSFPTLLAHSHFLLIPGPTDPYTSQVLPQPALPETMTQELRRRVPNITFGSNPCRIRYFTQEIVLYRDDLMSRMMRNAIQEGTQREEGDIRKAMIQQLMDNAHLAPLPLSVRPIYWEFDHALRLYPMPTALILADKYDPYKFQFEECLVFNPGQFARKQFSWSTYYPQMVDPTERMEESELP